MPFPVNVKARESSVHNYNSCIQAELTLSLTKPVLSTFVHYVLYFCIHRTKGIVTSSVAFEKRPLKNYTINFCKYGRKQDYNWREEGVGDFP